MGKRTGAVRSVFSGLHRVRVRRPLSPVCALGTSPKRGSALRGGALHSIPQDPEVGHAEGLADEEIQRYHRVIRGTGDSCRGDAELF